MLGFISISLGYWIVGPEPYSDPGLFGDDAYTPFQKLKPYPLWTKLFMNAVTAVLIYNVYQARKAIPRGVKTDEDLNLFDLD